MSKVSAMQSLREARYAAARSQRPATVAPVPTLPAAQPAPAQPVDGQPVDGQAAPVLPDALDPTGAADLLTPSAVPSTDDEAPAEALCGHRSMNNRSCRRPAGHAEKNHRYQ